MATVSIRAGRVSEEDGGVYEVEIVAYAHGTTPDSSARVSGHVNIEPRRDGRAGYEACGQSLDAWMSSGLISILEREGCLTDEMLGEIVAVAGARVEDTATEERDSGVDADGDCLECGHPADNSSGHGHCEAACHRSGG